MSERPARHRRRRSHALGAALLAAALPPVMAVAAPAQHAPSSASASTGTAAEGDSSTAAASRVHVVDVQERAAPWAARQAPASAAGAPGAANDASDGPAVDRAPPVRLTIPSIGVDSSVVELGLDARGALETPSDFDTAGWYVDGPEPGEVGASVIAGHVDDHAGPAVFFRLHELEPGDEIVVGHADGTTTSFSVDRLEQHPKDAFPTESVYGHTEEIGLRLITCGGSFDQDQRSYRDNVIVFATARDP